MVILKWYSEAWVSVSKQLEDDFLVAMVPQRTAARRDCLRVFGGSDGMRRFARESTRTSIDPVPTLSQNQIRN